MTRRPAYHPLVSIIIPTYNRKVSLLRTLESLAHDVYPLDAFEVIVVDDGSSDDTGTIAGLSFPFRTCYLRQENQGDAIARNTGALQSQSEFLVFVDDDITVVPGFLSAMIEAHDGADRRIVVGTLIPAPVSEPQPFQQTSTGTTNHDQGPGAEVDFTACMSGFLSIKRKHYLELGMMQPVTRKGSSVWCDVEFAYRAYLQGYTFYRSAKAIGYHHDYTLQDLATSCQRKERVSKIGVLLFQRHPLLVNHIPMFHDKGPIAWTHDSPLLIARKCARQIVSSPPALRGMEGLVRVLEAHHPSPAILRMLYRWIMSAYIYKGYRQGLREADADKSRAVPGLSSGLTERPGVWGKEGEAGEPGENVAG